MGRRRTALAWLVAMAVAAGCASSGPTKRVTSTTTTSTKTKVSTAPRHAAASQIAASCLTDHPSGTTSTTNSIKLCYADVKSGATTTTGISPDSGTPVRVSPDGRSVAVLRNGTIDIIDRHTGGVRNLRQRARDTGWINDQHLAYLPPDGLSIRVIDLAAADRDAPPLPGCCAIPRGWKITWFAPSSSRVAVTLEDDAQRNGSVETVDLADGSVVVVDTGADHHYAWPAWSPDGTRLAYMASLSLRRKDFDVAHPRSPNVYVWSAGHGHAQLVGPPQYTGTTPTWLSDDELLWCANGIGLALGPAALATMTVGRPETLKLRFGSYGELFRGFPALPAAIYSTARP